MPFRDTFWHGDQAMKDYKTLERQTARRAPGHYRERLDMSIWAEFFQTMGFGLFIGICVAIVVKIFERQN